MLSEVYLKVGLIDDALHTARQGVAIHPRYIGGLRALALACHSKGLNDECLTVLKLVTEAMPEDQQAQKLFGRLSADAGDLDAARQAFRTLLEFVPEDVECRVEIESLQISGDSAVASPFGDADDDEEIIEDLEFIEEIDVFEEEEEVAKEAEVDKAPEVDKEPEKDPLSTATLAELYVKQGFIDKALEIYQSILANDPGNSAAATRISELEKSETVTAVEEPQKNTDNALSKLEGWLENIRRMKSCP
jgi:tetratricopeptide (TPR) repeat protein